MSEDVLTPGDVKVLCECESRLAFAYMRAAGAVRFGSRSLRISRRKFFQWLDENGCKDFSNAAASGTSGLIRSPESKKAPGAATKKRQFSGELNASDLPPIPHCRQPKQLPSANG